jgi:hypothetical protein
LTSFHDPDRQLCQSAIAKVGANRAFFSGKGLKASHGGKDVSAVQQNAGVAVCAAHLLKSYSGD